MNRNNIFADDAPVVDTPVYLPDDQQWVQDQVTAQPLPEDRPVEQPETVQPDVKVHYNDEKEPDMWVTAQDGTRYPLWYENKAKEDLNKSMLWRLANNFIPKGYGTYIAVGVWMLVNMAGALGLDVPGFDAINGNEGAAMVGGAILAYLRRAMDK